MYSGVRVGRKRLPGRTPRGFCDKAMATTDKVGERIRRRRMEMGLNLRQLAEKTGVSASFLSQVEHGKVNVSLGSLQNISEALNVPLLYFVKEQVSEKGMVSSQGSETHESALAYQPVIRADARPQMFFPFSGVSYELLVPGFGQKMVAFLCKFAPGTENVVRQLREPTEEFIYVVSGKLLVGLESGRFELDAGDTIYFSGNELREILCASPEEEVVWISVITPPVF